MHGYLDVWGALWDLATAEPEGPARIELDPEDSGTVVLVYPDGSRGTWYWHDGGWRPSEQHNACPGDVGARDSF